MSIDKQGVQTTERAQLTPLRVYTLQLQVRIRVYCDLHLEYCSEHAL